MPSIVYIHTLKLDLLAADTTSFVIYVRLRKAYSWSVYNTIDNERNCLQDFLSRSRLLSAGLIHCLLRPIALYFSNYPSGTDNLSSPCIPSTLRCCPPWQASLWQLLNHLSHASAAGSQTSQDGTLQRTWPSLSRRFGIIVRRLIMVEICTVSRTMAGIRSWPQRGKSDCVRC